MSLSRGLSSLSVVSDDMSISKCSQNSDDYTETELSQFSTISTQSKEAKVDYMEIVNNVRQPSCCCNRNQNITYKVQYVMALLSFVGGLTFFNSRALNHDASIATWMTCLMFSFAASRLYLAAAKQQAMMHLFQPHQAQMEGLVSIVERDGKFAALELSYFHVANNHLGGGIWYGIGFAQVARLVLVVHVTNDSIFKIMVFPLFVWALLYFLVPAVSLSPKCFPPRSPRHAFILKIFIIACSMTLAAAMYSSTEIDGLSIINTSKDHINMQIAATTQFVYALVLCLSPRVFPVYLAEILSMACMVGFWASMLEVLEARIL